MKFTRVDLAWPRLSYMQVACKLMKEYVLISVGHSFFFFLLFLFCCSLFSFFKAEALLSVVLAALELTA